MGRYKSHNWLNEFGGGYCIIYDTFEPGPLVTAEKKSSPVFARVEIVSEQDKENPAKLVRSFRFHRLGLFDDDKAGEEFQAFVNSLEKAREDQAVWALQTIKEAGEGFAQALVELAGKMNLSAEQFEIFQQGLEAFKGIGEVIKNETSKGKAQG